MAEQKKSIEISYKANISDLKKKLEQLPDITADEAKKMVSALDRQLKQAERAAKRSANASQKAARASAKAAKKGSMDFKKLASSATMVAGAFTAMGAGVLAFSQDLADLTNQLTDASAKTGIAVDTLAGLRLAAEGSGLSFENLEGGLIRFQSSMDNAAKGSKTIQDSFKTLGVEVKDMDGNLRDADSVFNEAIKSLGEMENTTERNAIAMRIFGRQGGAGLIQSGALDNLENMKKFAKEFGIAIDEDAIGAMGNFQRKMAEFDTVAQGTFQRVIKSITGSDEGITRGIELATNAIIFLGSQAEDSLNFVSANFQHLFMLIKAGSLAIEKDFDGAFLLIEESSKNVAEAAENFLNQYDRAAEKVKEINNLTEQQNEKQKEITSEIKKQADEEERRKKAAAAFAKAQKEFAKDQQKIRDESRELVNLLTDRITPEYTKQKNEIKALGIEIENQLGLLDVEKSSLEDIAKQRELTVKESQSLKSIQLQIGELEKAQFQNRKAEQKELDELFLETQKKKIDAIEEENKKRQDAFEAEKRHQAAIVGGIGDFFGALDELSASFQDGTKEGNIRAFEMQKQLSTANIIMKTAEAVMTAQLLPPPLNAIQTGVAVATGAAQIAKVQSAQPPSMHMGGVAPDETTARVLKGEAILSRSAVAQLGGEEGIRQIEQGNEQKNETVVIIQPFKHFGRFARELGYTQPKQTGVRGY